MLKTLSLPRHLGIRFLLQIYVMVATDIFSLCLLEAWVATNDIKTLMMFSHHVICAAFRIVIWNVPTDKFVYKILT